MPFKVKFMIYEPGKQAPCYTTSDAALARVEYNAKVREQGMALSRYVYEITCEELTKTEEYVWLVYQVRQAIHKYYNQGRKYADLQASLVLEKQLDDWNLRTRTYLNNHPVSDRRREGACFLPASGEMEGEVAQVLCVQEGEVGAGGDTA